MNIPLNAVKAIERLSLAYNRDKNHIIRNVKFRKKPR